MSTPPVIMPHRGVNPPRDAALGSRRQSTVFFHRPNYDAVIERLPGCRGPDNPPRYEPVTSGQHRFERVPEGEGVAPQPAG